MDDAIHHISDTAYWIAGYRALETKRSDAAFRDHLAQQLAGQKGLDMVAMTPHTDAMAFAMTVRTSAIDRLVERAIARNVDTVINLAAGLDTRPYRMPLPPTLQWIEVDFPAVIAYKETQLKNETPRCKLKRIPADLSSPNARRELFNRLGTQTKNALVITEGLIGYLTREEAAGLSKDIFDTPSFTYWVQDYARGKMSRHKRTKDLGKMLKRSPLKFDVMEPIPFFAQQGWIVADNIHILDEADRIGRKFPVMFPWNLLMSLNFVRNAGNKAYGYVMLGRATKN